MYSRVDRTVIKRLATSIMLAGNATFAIGWWWLMPGGFPVGHVRFWMNAVWPIVLLLISVVGLTALFLRRADWTKACVTMLGCMVLSITITAPLIFPDIKRSVLLAATTICLLEFAVVRTLVAPSMSRRLLAGPILAGIVLGAFLPIALRAEAASTVPLDLACPWDAQTDGITARDGSIQSIGAAGRVEVLPSSGAVAIKLGQVRLMVDPLLTFRSTSPSGGWSALSRQSRSHASAYARLSEVLPSAVDGVSDRVLFRGAADWLGVEGQGRIEITAYSKIPNPVYSHLNTFCMMTIHGHQKLELTFSPCGKTAFEPRPADYPVGRPARFAYCDTVRTFRVVEAHSGEKGPFVTLGEGQLQSDRFSMGIMDNGARVATMHLDDWAMQLSTALSPTAGWGVAVNAIEFQRMDSDPRAPVMIWITLAGTSVGRGWDTVGHSAGTYRNRIIVETGE